jgi:fumarate reductase subunit C
MGRDFQERLSTFLVQRFPFITAAFFVLYLFGVLPEDSMLYYALFSFVLLPVIILLQVVTGYAPRN